MRWLLAALAFVALVAPVSLAQAPAATGQGITIAVLDTGIDAAHTELAGRVSRVSFVQPTLPVPLPVAPPADLGTVSNDPSGQGTAVASLAAGKTLGIAPAANLLDLQVSAKYSNGLIDPATEQAAIQALDYLLQDPSRAQVVLLSFAMGGVSTTGAETLTEQVQGLRDAGVVVIVPTGPTSNDLASAPAALTVAGSESCPPTSSGPALKPDLVAKSQGLRAAQPGNAAQTGGTTTVSGTAYAAAQAAGAAALVLSADKAMPADAVMSFLRDAAVDQKDKGPDVCTGFGLLDPAAALLWASKWSDPLASSPPRNTPGIGLLATVAIVTVVAALRRRA